MRIPLDIDGFEAVCDAAGGFWRVTAGGTEHSLRPWRWGERRRLIGAAAASGRLDATAFVEGLVETLYDPPPARELSPVFACAAMRLLGVAEDADVPPLADAEARIAERFGWRPSEIEAERAGDIDTLLGTLPSAAAPTTTEGDGWTRIRFEEDAP